MTRWWYMRATNDATCSAGAAAEALLAYVANLGRLAEALATVEALCGYGPGERASRHDRRLVSGHAFCLAQRLARLRALDALEPLPPPPWAD